tara:strand:+ start:11022 stop:11702 length:681 start_codon:yes stop_codon:yes gene_type:complete
MKKLVLLCAGAVLALPAYGNEAALRPAYEIDANPWSRPYVGLNLGVASGTTTFGMRDASGSLGDVSFTSGGLTGGIRLGYDHVVSGNALLGVRGGFDFTNVSVDGEVAYNGTTLGRVSHTLDWLGTLGGRIGMTEKNMLYYAHAAAAFGGVSSTVDGNDIPGLIENPRMGYEVGVGLEYAIGEHATFATEYGYTDFGTFDLYHDGGLTVSDDLAFHRLTAGVTLRF